VELHPDVVADLDLDFLAGLVEAEVDDARNRWSHGLPARD
jgi:hypothetical protein